MKSTLISLGLVLTFASFVVEGQDSIAPDVDFAPNGPSRTSMFESEVFSEPGEQAEFLVARTLHDLSRTFKDMNQDEVKGNVEIVVEKARKVLDRGMKVTKGMDIRNVEIFVEFVKGNLDKRLAKMNTTSAWEMEQEILGSVEGFLTVFTDYMQSSVDAVGIFDILA